MQRFIHGSHLGYHSRPAMILSANIGYLAHLEGEAQMPCAVGMVRCCVVLPDSRYSSARIVPSGAQCEPGRFHIGGICANGGRR